MMFIFDTSSRTIDSVHHIPFTSFIIYRLFHDLQHPNINNVIVNITDRHHLETMKGLRYLPSLTEDHNHQIIYEKVYNYEITYDVHRSKTKIFIALLSTTFRKRLN